MIRLTVNPRTAPTAPASPAASGKSDRYSIAEQPAPEPRLAHPEGCAAPRIVIVSVPCASRSCEQFPEGFDLHLLHRPVTALEPRGNNLRTFTENRGRNLAWTVLYMPCFLESAAIRVDRPRGPLSEIRRDKREFGPPSGATPRTILIGRSTHFICMIEVCQLLRGRVHLPPPLSRSLKERGAQH